MKKNRSIALTTAVAGLLAASALVWPADAADTKNVVGEVMNTYHKAPKGVDPVCKKVADGKASPEEIKKLVQAYKLMAATQPPKGDAASWKDKTAKLLAAAQAVEKGAPEALAKFKEAVNCKACHSAHRPD